MPAPLKTFNVVVRHNGKVSRSFDVYARTAEKAVAQVHSSLMELGDTITIGEVTRTVQDEHAYAVTEDGIVEKN